jgi:hypothetical protein
MTAMRLFSDGITLLIEVRDMAPGRPLPLGDGPAAESGVRPEAHPRADRRPVGLALLRHQTGQAVWAGLAADRCWPRARQARRSQRTGGAL